MDALLEDVRQEAWGGMIPTELSMDSSEVTSLQMPLPLYLLLPRMGFLPCVAEAISHHFGEVAPDAQRTLWLEETRSGEPLRWHIPTGVLFDLIAGVGKEEGGGAAGVIGGATHGEAIPWSGPGRLGLLPWRITVHFQGCPRRQVFPLEKEADIRRHYTNALKQALFLQSGSSRAGMTLAKENQNRLWQAIKSNDTKVFHEMDALLGGGRGTVRLVPVRLLTGGAPPSQLPIPAQRPGGTPFTLRDCLCWFCPGVLWDAEDGAEDAPVSQQQQQQQQQQAGIAAAQSGKEGDVGRRDSTAEGTVNTVDTQGNAAERLGVEEKLETDTRVIGGQQAGMLAVSGGGAGAMSLPTVLVQGVEVPLDAPITQLWGALRHPDHFLYIVVRKQG
ncbi:unnamed protein product [Ectocarpus sp. 12 AP-2014]